MEKKTGKAKEDKAMNGKIGSLCLFCSRQQEAAGNNANH